MPDAGTRTPTHRGEPRSWRIAGYVAEMRRQAATENTHKGGVITLEKDTPNA